MSTELELLSPPFSGDDIDALRLLNNQHAEELSFKTVPAFVELLHAATHVRALPNGGALLVGFDDQATYDNPNFRWLKTRFERFYYIDRVVVSSLYRGRGVARLLYEDLQRRAVLENRQRLVCEINSTPPNPASDEFHQRLGFEVIGSQELVGQGKTVRYWAKELVL